MSGNSGNPSYARYAEFLSADPRRRGDALELGHDWREGGRRFRVCWYAATGEVVAERLATGPALELEDFHRGVEGPVQVVGRCRSRAELESVLGAWPEIACAVPRTVSRLRELLQSAH